LPWGVQACGQQEGLADIEVTEGAGGAGVLHTEAGAISVGAAGASASLDAGTGQGRIRNALKNTEGTADLTIHATTGYGDTGTKQGQYTLCA
jgi:hypothetical protein